MLCSCNNNAKVVVRENLKNVIFRFWSRNLKSTIQSGQDWHASTRAGSHDLADADNRLDMPIHMIAFETFSPATIMNGCAFSAFGSVQHNDTAPRLWHM